MIEDLTKATRQQFSQTQPFNSISAPVPDTWFFFVIGNDWHCRYQHHLLTLRSWLSEKTLLSVTENNVRSAITVFEGVEQKKQAKGRTEK